MISAACTVLAGVGGCFAGSLIEDSCRGRTVRHAHELICYQCGSETPDRVCVQCNSCVFCEECFHNYHKASGYAHYRFFFIGKMSEHGGTFPTYDTSEEVTEFKKEKT